MERNDDKNQQKRRKREDEENENFRNEVKFNYFLSLDTIMYSHIKYRNIIIFRAVNKDRERERS